MTTNIPDKRIHCTFSARDDQFDTENIGSYYLYLATGKSSFNFTVIDPVTKRCLFLESYSFQLQNPVITEFVELLNVLFDSHLFLKANYWSKIFILLKGTAFTLVPRELFQEKGVEKYLSLSYEAHPEDKVIFREQNSFDAVNITVVNEQLLAWFSSVYPKKDFICIHQTFAFLEAIRKIAKLEPRPITQVHIFVEQEYFILCILKNKTKDLEFCNIFSYRSASDLAYYVLFVIDELRIDRENLLTRLYGSIEKPSEIYLALNRYLPEVNIWTEKPNWLNFAYFFDEVRHQQYFDLYGLSLIN